MYTIDSCLVCGETQRTVVAEYNRFIFMESMWQSDLARFDYALCHGCGLVYATRRPDRAEYDFLYDNFNEFLMRRENPNSLSVPELTPERAAEIDRQFVPWWEVKSVAGKGPIRKALLRDLDNALTYLPYIALHVPLPGAKVLHVRAKTSTLADMMKRVLGATQVDLITLFPAHTCIAEKYAGVRVQSCLDYEDFQIPFEERYDLIIENHILIHMLDPNQTFDVFRSHLEPGGAIFLHKEHDDYQLFQKGKNLFAELRPFHYHQFDIPTLERICRRYGFATAFVAHKGTLNPELLGIVRLEHEPIACPRIGAAELRARLDMYARWRDESILSLPKERSQAVYGAELEQIWQRVKARGGLKKSLGEPVALRRFGEMEDDDEELEIDSAKRGRAVNTPARGLRGTAGPVRPAERFRAKRVTGRLAQILGRPRWGEWRGERAPTKSDSAPPVRRQ
jgi:hypothetical protein